MSARDDAPQIGHAAGRKQFVEPKAVDHVADIELSLHEIVRHALVPAQKAGAENMRQAGGLNLLRGASHCRRAREYR